MSPVRRPAPRPCGSCPYRRDVPSGVWAAEEYASLPPFDRPTWDQPVGVFLCHQDDGRLCAGWAGCHDMAESLGLRIAAASGEMEPGGVTATLGYACPVPLFESGAAAAAHGIAEITTPGPGAGRVIDKLRRRRAGEGEG